MNDDDLKRRIEAFLDAGPITDLAPVGGGYSRLMRRFDAGGRRYVWRGDPPPEQQIVLTDRAREHAVLAALDGAGGAPKAVRFDSDGSALGTTSIILEYIEGDQLMTLLGQTPQDGWGTLIDATAALMAGIHACDKPGALPQPSGWSAYIDACLEEWRALESEQVEPAPLLRYVTTWLDRNRPPEVPLVLVHGDFQSPNVILRDGAARAIDWEFSRIGDPREDLGYFAAMCAISPPDPIAGDLGPLCAAYREHSGLGEDVINPLTVAYFTILPFGPMVRRFNSQVVDLVEGRNRSLKTANLAVVTTAMLDGWTSLIRRLDAAMQSPREPTP